MHHTVMVPLTCGNTFVLDQVEKERYITVIPHNQNCYATRCLVIELPTGQNI